MAIVELTKVESILNGNDYDKYGIQYILKKDENILAICNSHSNPEDIVEVVLNTDCSPVIEKIHEWDYSIYDDFLYYLEEGYKIIYIPLTTHYGIWCNLVDEEDIFYKKGLQRYINYFVENEFNVKKVFKLFNV